MFIVENFVLVDVILIMPTNYGRGSPNGTGSEIYEKVDATRLLFKS